MADTENLSNQVENYILQFVADSINTDSFNLITLAGDASNRRYFRVIHDNSSSVLMVWEPFKNTDDYPFLSVQNLFAKHGVRVPKVLSISAEKGLILLEDLGDLTLERKFWEQQNQENVIPFYKMAMDEILKIHFETGKDEVKSATCFQIEFDKDKFMWELNYTKKHLLEGVCGVKLTADEEASLRADYNQICETLVNEPKRICHRDYHSRNLMLKFDKMYVIDFQDARLGPVQYDLVSLLCDSYVNLENKTIRKLLSYYLDKAQSEYGAYFEYDQFMEIFRVQQVQRCFKACGSFASFYNSRGDERYLEYIHPTLVNLYTVLEDHDIFPALKNILKIHGLLEFDFEAGL